MSRRVRLAAIAAIALLGLVFLVWWLKPQADGTPLIVRDPITFNLRYPAGFAKAPPRDGEVLRLERRNGGEVLDALTITPITLPRYTGDVGAMLPTYAEKEIAALRARFPGFELVQEGKARVNDVAGYTLVFRASRTPRLYGRLTILPRPPGGQPESGSSLPIIVRDAALPAVRILLLAVPGSGVATAPDVGVHGAVKIPYRTFRFGTEAP
jgi:hypothetical protein